MSRAVGASTDAGGRIAVRRCGHEPIDAAGMAWEPTPWRAVQRAAWEVLSERRHRRELIAASAAA